MSKKKKSSKNKSKAVKVVADIKTSDKVLASQTEEQTETVQNDQAEAVVTETK